MNVYHCHSIVAPAFLAVVFLGSGRTQDNLESEYIPQRFQDSIHESPKLAWVLPDGTVVAAVQSPKIVIYSLSSRLENARRRATLTITDSLQFAAKNHVACNTRLSEKPPRLTLYDSVRKPGQKNHQVLYTTKEPPGLRAGYTSSRLEDSIAKEVWTRMQPKSPQQPRSSTTIRRDGTPYSYLLVALYDGPQNEISRTGIFLLEGKGHIIATKIDDINGWCDGCAVPTSDGGIASVYSVVNMFTAPQFLYPLLMLDTSTLEGRSITLATFTPEKKYSDYLLYEYTVGCG
jgi:hypothetical protein